jgi:hypothetical protein
MTSMRRTTSRIPADHGEMSPAAASVLWAAALGLAKAIRADSDEDEPVAATSFAPEWDALVGRWFGDGTPGSFESAYFRYELGGRVLTRRGIAHDADGARHEDLMTIYPAADGRDAEVMYHDRDGHVIHYAVTWSADRRGLVLLSLPEAGAPRYRLTWRLDGADTLVTSLEIAPPGSEAFAGHSGGTLMRTGT